MEREIVELIAEAIALFGIAIIVYGTIVAAYRTIQFELVKRTRPLYPDLRGDFNHRVILGLDFLIASDIISSVVIPTLEETLRLGGIVIIRVALTIILNYETERVEREEERHRRRKEEVTKAKTPPEK